MVVGCCGLAGLGLREYAKRFSVLEVQSTFYRLPMKSTVERWRRTAPKLIFTMKAFQGITHPPDSPTWRKAARELEGVDPAEVGLLKPSGFIRKSWERTVDIAMSLGAKVVVVQLPPSFRYSMSNMSRLGEFFSSADYGFTPAVEFRHESWFGRLELARKALEKCEGVVVTDPLKVTPPTQPIQYHRLHGADGLVNYRHRYTDDELRELNRRIACAEVYVLFNNLSMKEDAERFSMIVGSSRAGT